MDVADLPGNDLLSRRGEDRFPIFTEAKTYPSVSVYRFSLCFEMFLLKFLRASFSWAFLLAASDCRSLISCLNLPENSFRNRASLNLRGS